jgi:hypothetical protein
MVSEASQEGHGISAVATAASVADRHISHDPTVKGVILVTRKQYRACKEHFLEEK